MEKEKLKDVLKKEKIEILKEEKGLVPELIVNKVPENNKKYDKKKAWQRTYFSSIKPFFIKNSDKGKTKGGYSLTEIEELRNEVKVWKDNPNIPIVTKIAILKLEDSEKCFLVEELHTEFNSEWNEKLIERMGVIQKKLKKEFELDCKKDNFVYDEKNDELLLIDICVVTPRSGDARN